MTLIKLITEPGPVIDIGAKKSGDCTSPFLKSLAVKHIPGDMITFVLRAILTQHLVESDLTLVESNSQNITEIILILKTRSEEHTSELRSRGHLVCRLLLEKKKRQQV